MTQHITHIAYRRKRDGLTNYHKRLITLKGRTPRVVIRKSLKYITIQVIEYLPSGDKVLVSARSKELQELGWTYGLKNTSASYLTGLLLGKKAQVAGITSGIIDLGLYNATSGNKLFAAIKGVVDSGLSVSATERIQGAHIKALGKGVPITDNFNTVQKGIQQWHTKK